MLWLLTGLFKQFDKDGSGELNLQEIEGLFSDVPKEFPVDELFRVSDYHRLTNPSMCVCVIIGFA